MSFVVGLLYRQIKFAVLIFFLSLYSMSHEERSLCERPVKDQMSAYLFLREEQEGWHHSCPSVNSLVSFCHEFHFGYSMTSICSELKIEAASSSIWFFPRINGMYNVSIKFDKSSRKRGHIAIKGRKKIEGHESRSSHLIQSIINSRVLHAFQDVLQQEV